MRSRIPLAYAALLIVALVAAVGLAAFSAGSVSDTPTTDTSPTIAAQDISARVASAVLALEVTPEEASAAGTTDATTTSIEGLVSEEDTDQDSKEPTTTAATSEDPTPQTTAPAPPPPDTTPPPLHVTSPDDGATVGDRIVTFSGTSESGAKVFSGPFEADVAANGDWTIKLVLVPGPNGALITARDAAGNESSARMVVHYDAPETTTTTKVPSPTTTSASATSTTASPAPQWSPNWPADSGGQRDVEYWRSTVQQYWPTDRVDCVLGIIKRESRGNPRAYNSSSGASGLMQHLSKYWKGRAAGAGFVDGNGLYATPYNGAANIAAGAYLGAYYDGIGKNWWAPWYSLPSYGSCNSG